MEKVILEVTLKMDMEGLDAINIDEKLNPAELLSTGRIRINEVKVLITDPDGDIISDDILNPDEIQQAIIEVFEGGEP